MTGEAIPTPGYRGMHSYILNFEDYFVPAENLVGDEGGQGRGFYLTLGGFAIGRLQTGGRALGVAQAALEKACQYMTQRSQFGKPISEYQLTQYRIGHDGDAHRGGAPAHLRRRAHDGPDGRGAAWAGDGEAVRVGRRGVGDAGGAAAARRLGLRRGGPHHAATSPTRRCCRSSRA